MLIKDFITESYVNAAFKTKAVDILSKTPEQFLQGYSSVKNLKTLTQDFVEEYNEILKMLHRSGAIVFTLVELGDNGVGTLKELGKLEEYIPPTYVEIFHRKKQAVSYKIDIKDSVGVFDTLQNLGCTTAPLDTFVALHFIKKQMSCAERGIEFGLSFDDMRELLSTEKCHYSGVPLMVSGTHHISLDRIDSKLGYIKGNVVACSSYVNQLKNSLIESKHLTNKLTDKELKSTLVKIAKLI